MAIIYGQVRRYKENRGCEAKEKKGGGESIGRKSWRRTSVTRVTYNARRLYNRRPPNVSKTTQVEAERDSYSLHRSIEFEAYRIRQRMGEIRSNVISLQGTPCVLFAYTFSFNCLRNEVIIIIAEVANNRAV